MITLTKADSSAVDFVQFRVSGDTAVFIGPSSTDMTTEELIIKSVPPKRGNNQYGNRRSTANLVRATSVIDMTGAPVVRNRKLSIDVSLPVGTVLADVIDDAYQLSTLLSNASFVEKLFTTGIIEY